MGKSWNTFRAILSPLRTLNLDKNFFKTKNSIIPTPTHFSIITSTAKSRHFSPYNSSTQPQTSTFRHYPSNSFQINPWHRLELPIRMIRKRFCAVRRTSVYIPYNGRSERLRRADLYGNEMRAACARATLRNGGKTTELSAMLRISTRSLEVL